MYKHKNNCRICGSKKLTKFLDLGQQPLANSFLKTEDDFLAEKKYPLAVYFCHDCNLVQLLDIVDKEVMFCNYIYFTSGMPKISNHFKRYAEDIIERFLRKNDFVAEIASNDGILLKFFKDLGFRTLGIDPAANVVEVAESLGVETIVDFFSENVAKDIRSKYGPAKVILANNVVAHIDDHYDLARGINTFLADDGVFIFEAPYLIDMFENLAYDTIYHEHLSFLAVRPLKILFDKFGLEIFDVELHPVQGQSIRCFVAKKGVYPISDNVEKFTDREIEMGLDKFESYEQLARQIAEQKERMIEVLADFKQKGKKIAAYGAPAKGNTMLNFCGVDDKIIDFALEHLPVKQGLFTPGSHIKVVSPDFALANQPDAYLMLAWNYKETILEREKEFLAKGGQFVIPTKGIEIV